jgi:FAD/FMN-containing dehydrogenase
LAVDTDEVKASEGAGDMAKVTGDAVVRAGMPQGFRGQVFRPGSSGYGEARRIFNMRRAQDTPAFIARAADAEDVVRVMRHASEHDVPVAIRAGGHGVDGSSMPDGGLVLDVSALRAVAVDPATRRVRVGAGVLLGDLDTATRAHGLVVPSGTVSTTGVAGLTLGGGVGYLMRRFGATVDSLLGCDVVTVGGKQVHASERENADLFWALRGGGGNFGVVTAFEFQGHPLGPEVTGGPVIFPLDQAGEVLSKLRSYMTSASRELAVIGALTPCPPFPPVTATLHGVPVLILIVVHSGALAAAVPIIQKLASFGRPAANLVAPAPWVQVNRMLDVIAPYGRRVHTRGGYLSELGDDVIATGCAWASNAPAPSAPGPSSVQNFWFLGGAVSEDLDEDSVAFSREGAKVFWECVGQWDGPERDATFTAWVDGVAEALAPNMRANGYVNLTTDRGPAWLRGLYGSERKFERLVAAKTAWDPGNLLRFNKNFEPAPRATVA